MKLTWTWGGLLLGAVFFAGVWLAKPVGISTEFAVFGGMLWHLFDPSIVEGATSTNAYFASDKGAIAKAISSPWTNYGVLFALATATGGLLSNLMRRFSRGDIDPYTRQERLVEPGASRDVPLTTTTRFGAGLGTRMVLSFLGGVVVLYGARLAGGCTSGHMMSGMMQTSISGYLFALAAFGLAVPTARFLYRKAA